MSAFVVSDNHLNALITWAALTETRPGSQGASFSYNDGPCVYFRGNEKRYAAILYTANVESVNARYGDDSPAVKYVFRHYKAWEDLTPVVILKLCDCFDYQACEVRHYRITFAAQMIEGIRSHAISLLPGYEAAPWGLGE